MKRRRLKKRYRIIFSLLSIGIFITLTIPNYTPITYSRYKTEVNVDAKSTTGNMVCNLEVDNNNYYEDNIPYFIITVKNYDSNGNITATDVSYDLSITNKTDSNGLYRYVVLDDQSTNNTYESSVLINGLTFSKEKQEKKIKVYVQVASGENENVDFNVDVAAVQKNMD